MRYFIDNTDTLQSIKFLFQADNNLTRYRVFYPIYIDDSELRLEDIKELRERASNTSWTPIRNKDYFLETRYEITKELFLDLL